MNKPLSQTEAEWPARWTTLDHGVRVGRYIDKEFLELEFAKLWSKVWQVAARVDAIPEVNDFITYDIGDQSVFLVRTDADTIKAYHNVCPHRGTALAEGSGSFNHGNIICPFHGWRWNTEGDIQYVLSREEFHGGKLCDSDVALKSLNCVVYAGFVFINFDRDCIPFEEYIAPVRHLLDDINVKEMRHYWWKKIPVPANWKVAQEAFFEGYHVPATHPQLEVPAADFIYGEKIESEFTDYNHHNVDYEAFANGHGRFFAGRASNYQGNVKRFAVNKDPVDAMADRLQLLVDGMDAQVLQGDVDLLRSLKGKPMPEGSNLGAEYVRILYEDAAAKERPMPKMTPEILNMWGGMIYIFPNVMVFPQAGNAMIYRSMPDPKDPDRSTFEIFSTRSLPKAEKPQRAEVELVSNPNDPDQVYLIPRQDLGNLERIQKGLHSHSIKQVWLASHQEKIILNMHQRLDQYVKAE
ncbi:aromatic ring-hydroxylating dioxygenase subunit alpha [Halioxenophilus sp. WMMB6]|uniref:aromatic ring-hydroxylating oxygenase subunit alpha n=1 Tax=Halioxenophilus sp. WMMB6 TaxID=3073815 RepID=UPI00295E9356|nr:aromatic ring-hydroxylating dioxygenase subunit alpha [Halioxenophilus sp. WMMB6]